jgi:peptide/nickel transport system substrate-binding protein
MNRIASSRRLRWTTAVIAGLTLLTACGSGEDGGDPGGDSGAPVAGGTLRVGLPVDAGCVDPQQVRPRVTLMVGRTMVESLVYQDPDTGEYLPWLADSWEVNEDGTSYTFTLQEGVTFSDGTPFDAEVVKANIDGVVALGAKASLAGRYLTGYVGTTVVDPMTARVEFSAPSAPFLQAASTVSLGMLSLASATAPAEVKCTGEKLVGTGPFVFSEYNAEENIVVTKREDDRGWAYPDAEHEGAPYLDSIDFKIIPESGVRAGSLASDQLDLDTEIHTEDQPTLEAQGMPIIVRSNPGLALNYFINTKRPIMNDVNVRRAILMGINREEIKDTVLSDLDEIASSPLSSTTPGWIDLSSELEYDREGAEELLDEAGWKVGADGIRAKDGQRLTFSIMYQTPLFNILVPNMEVGRQQLAEIGIDMTLRPLPTAEATVVQTQTLDYDMLISGGTRADGDILRTNFRGLSPELDALLNEQLATVDLDARNELLADAQRLIIEDALAIPINELVLPNGHRPEVKGLTYDAESILTFVDTWVAAS